MDLHGHESGSAVVFLTPSDGSWRHMEIETYIQCKKKNDSWDIQTPSKNATTSGKHTHAWHLLLVNHVLLVICVCSFFFF